MKKTKRIKNNRCDSIFSFSANKRFKADPKSNEDPVLKANRKEKKPQDEEAEPSGKAARETPSFGKRQEIKSHCVGNEPVLEYGDPRRPYELPKYLPPKTKKYMKGRKEAKKKYEEELNFCKHIMETTDMPNIPAKEKILQITIPSPEQSQAKVKPRSLSPTTSTDVPVIPNRKQLELKKPKSGIIINEKDKIPDYDSFDLVYRRKPRPGFEKELRALKKKKKPLQPIHEENERKEFEALLEKELLEHAYEGEEDGADTRLMGDLPTKPMNEMEGEMEEEGELTKVFRKKVEQLSKSTSYQPKDYGGIFEDRPQVKLAPVVQMTQKFRRGSEIERFIIPAPKIKRGTLESHSFTKLHQTTLKDFFYGTVAGTMHQAAEHFPEQIRNNQGLTMPVCAYCYALLKHPNTWKEKDIDEIIEAGNAMYMDCLHKMNHRTGAVTVSPDDLPRYCYLLEKRIRFKIHEPQVTGIIKSDQKNVYNLTKGVQIFFSRHNAGIFQTKGVNIAIWRDKYFYFFDARPRTGDLYPDPEGTALMCNFYDIESVITVLLSRCFLGNWPFVILSMEAVSIKNRHDLEERESLMDLEDKIPYSVLSERKAVVQGSFDLADKCFEFSRNKQAVAMAAVALVYSRISPPSSWFKKIVDKIMIIGNQLYLECMEHKPLTELKLEQLPAEFTLGPYSVEIYIKPKVYGDYICRKGTCVLEILLERFFETYSMAILVLESSTIAVWKQRGVFYCFDPYSRNVQGYTSRNGVACVSMHTDLDSLTWMIAKNYCGKDATFDLHALVVCRIIREPAITCAIPETKKMDTICDEELKKTTKKKGHKTAVEKHKPIEVKEDANKSISEPPMKIADDESLVEVDSNVGSLALSTFPHLPHVIHVKEVLGADKVADLESPSLSDTQVEPPRVKVDDDNEVMMRVDIDSYQLTMEELEGKIREKGEGDEKKVEDKGKTEAKPAVAPKPAAATAGGDQKKEEEQAEESYTVADEETIIHSKSLLNATSVNLSAELSAFMLHPEVLPPTNLSQTLSRRRRVFTKYQQGSLILGYETEPDVTQSEELRKENNFLDLPDKSQIVRGTSNMADLEGQDGDMEYLAPFVCIMAAAVTKKFTLVSWSADVVDYVLKCGQELFKASKFRYDQVSRLDIPKVSLGSTDFHITVDYLFDTYLKDNILEVALDRLLFTRSDCGIFVTPTYSCAIFYRHHLYYLYDGYGNNEVGLSEGKMNTGCACLIRFKDLRSLVQRVIYNKSVREGVEPVEFSRFVISRVEVLALNPPKPTLSDEERGEEDEWIDLEDVEGEEAEEEEEGEGDTQKETKPKIEVGWKWYQGIATIRGSKCLKGRGVGENEIKVDHFACICACLMLIEVPLDEWDTTKVDYCLEQGRNIYKHADDLCATEKRIIKNVLIQKHFFDIIVKKIQIINYSQNKDLETGIDTLFGRRYSYFVVQMVGCCNVICKGRSNCYYLFDPYAINRKGKPSKEGKAGWVRYKKLRQLKRRLKHESMKYGGLYSFYTFEVTSIKKAPKGLVIGHKMHLYEVDKPKKKKEIMSKPFHEEVYWLNMDPIPWTRKVHFTPAGLPRGCPETMWHNWDIEYNNDLYSMPGNIHQSSLLCPEDTRGKQTLCNFVMCIGMLQIYDLVAWSPAIIDSVVVNGDNYCRECMKDITEENHELGVDDLKKDCEIFPYSFKVVISNVVDGTMFLLRSKSFNLYKALKYFFDGFESRFGIIVATKKNGRRQVAFGKTKELEYFMFDCEAVGAPMFADGKAVAYILRTTTLNRLLHVLALTLRGGDFFIFEVKTVGMKTVG